MDCDSRPLVPWASLSAGNLLGRIADRRGVVMTHISITRSGTVVDRADHVTDEEYRAAMARLTKDGEDA